MKRDPFEINTNFSKPKSKKALDWEESAYDTEANVNEVHDFERLGPGSFWLPSLIFLAFIILTLKLFSLQILQGVKFRALSDSNRVRQQSLLAPRGLILDNR